MEKEKLKHFNLYNIIAQLPFAEPAFRSHVPAEIHHCFNNLTSVRFFTAKTAVWKSSRDKTIND